TPSPRTSPANCWRTVSSPVPGARPAPDREVTAHRELRYRFSPTAPTPWRRRDTSGPVAIPWNAVSVAIQGPGGEAFARIGAQRDVLGPAGNVRPIRIFLPGQRIEARGHLANESDVEVDVVLDPHVVAADSHADLEVAVEPVRELEAVARIRHRILA